MIQQDLEIINKLGLHARASAKFTQLAAGKGAKVTLEADGADEKECVEALTALINDKFGEGE
jgi:phosphocarrier protein